MHLIDADQIRALVNMPELIERLRAAFKEGHAAPPRQIVPVPGGAGDRLMLFMPAFAADGGGVVKLASIFPDNARSGAPTIQGALVVFSNAGAPVAVMDAAAVTQLRTAAASALASSYLSRADSNRLVVIGTGALAPYMALAHANVRPLQWIGVWGRNYERAAATAAHISRLVRPTIEVVPVEQLERAVRAADIISCVTSSTEPVLQGRWLKPGAFVDLVGSFSPHKRETDDEAVQRARIFVDTFEGALNEAGDLLDPMARGAIDRTRIEAELADLVASRKVGRLNDNEITLFKSVGVALEDLAAAQCVLAALPRSAMTDSVADRR
jgi:alanine dehydrogenase